MKIPTDLDPKPPLRRILAQNPPFKEFLDPPLGWDLLLVWFASRLLLSHFPFQGKWDIETAWFRVLSYDYSSS